MSACPVTVRMYRGILGDCFLLMIGPPGAENVARRSHVLIDCGVLQGVEGRKTRMREIVSNIAEVTGGRLDLVVVTHEHFDHIAGFQYAEDLFAGMEIGRVWFAWTEDPGDPKGQALQERFAAAHQKLAALQLGIDRRREATAAEQGEPTEAGDPDDRPQLMGLAGFMAPAVHLDGLAAGSEERGSKRIFANLRQWAGRPASGYDGAERIDYLKPGDVLPTPARPDAPSLTAYVLGPPYDDKFLFKALPSKGAAKETYLALQAEDDPEAASERSPFSQHFRWYTMPAPRAGPAVEGGEPPAAAEPPPFVKRRYLDDRAGCRFESGSAPAGHLCELDFVCARRQDYRRIDDMTEIAQGGLALKLDSNTNNTSLVLAFELPDRSTMIFAADAQVGNWLSWEKVEFRERRTRDKVEVTAAQLLARARLYKVGHHGSHNATLKAKGLELMTHPELVALIPTVESIAMEQGSKGWRMPNPETYKALIRQTKGRILRGDFKRADAADEQGGLANRIRAVVAAENERIDTEALEERKLEFDESFAPSAESDLYVDYLLDCRSSAAAQDQAAA